MGGRKKSIEPEYTPYQKLAIDISKSTPINIETFESALAKRMQDVAQQTLSQLQSIQQKRLEGLTQALMSAIGSVQYNPYAEKIVSAVEKLKQQKVEPLQKTQQDIISQYRNITPDVSKTLRMAGAYQAIPAIEPKSPGYASDISKEFKPAYESSINFLSETSSMLRNIGMTDEEIQSALSPYYSAMKEGESMALRYI